MNQRRVSVRRAGLVCAAFAAANGGCGGKTEPESVALVEVRQELDLGDRGPAVQAVYGYLRQYGYFPNSELAEHYPYWRPVVDKTPADTSYFGPEMQEAVQKYQKILGLEQTGQVDQPTLQIMKTPRCGHPDTEYAALSPSEKFALYNFTWNKSTVTYKITSFTSDVSQSSQSLTIANAYNTWRNNTPMEFSSTTGTPDIEIKFYPSTNIPGPTPNFSTGWTAFGGALARSWQTWMAINDDFTWDGTQYDLQSVVTHEAGHTIGIDHSSFPTAVMYPSFGIGQQRRGLSSDDLQAADALYSPWDQVPGLAVDVASGNRGNTWVTSGNNTIWSWNGTAFTQVQGNGVSIAMDSDGLPWVTSSDNSIWKRSGSSWAQRPGSAQDIGIGDGGQVWSIGTVPAGGGNFNVQHWNGFGWDQSDGIGVRVSVDHLGRVWVVQATGPIWRRTTSSGFSGSWEQLPGCATDVAGGPDGSVWIIGCNVVTGNERSIWLWDEQPAITGALAEKQWVPISGFANRITVGYDGLPWVSQSAGYIFHRGRR